MKLFQLLPKKLYDFACNLPTKTQKDARGTADCADFEQIKGVLPHAGLPVCFGNYHAGPKGQTFHGHRERNAPAGRRVEARGNEKARNGGRRERSAGG